MITFCPIILIISVLLSACDGQKPPGTSHSSYEQESTANSELWPTKLDDAVQLILTQLSDEDKTLIRTTKKTELSQFHSNWGRSIRNELGLYQGNDALREAACIFDANEYRAIKIAPKETSQTEETGCHPDEASIIIIGKVWEALKK